MELIFDILFDLIVEGSIGAVGDKKVPLALRIAASVSMTDLLRRKTVESLTTPKRSLRAGRWGTYAMN